MAFLARITLFPFKALDGQAVDSAAILPSGALQHDRRFALVDVAGRYINGKRTDKLHPIRSSFDPQHQRLELVNHGELATFHVAEDREEIEQYFSLLLNERVRLLENRTHGFPDDTDAPGPTVISTATLEAVASWFPGLTHDEVRRRFRANLEIGGVEPFWEDRLAGPAGEGVPLRIGKIMFEGMNPCQRCVVPTRAAHTGEPWPGFQKTFAQQREKLLPIWANRSRFNHFYRLAINTRLAPNSLGGEIRCSEPVEA